MTAVSLLRSKKVGLINQLVNICNANTESEQQETVSNLVSIIDKVKDIQSKNIVLGGDFNVIFDISLEILGGKSMFEKEINSKIDSD